MDDRREIFSGCQRMAKVPNAVEILPKICLSGAHDHWLWSTLYLPFSSLTLNVQWQEGRAAHVLPIPRGSLPELVKQDPRGIHRSRSHGKDAMKRK